MQNLNINTILQSTEKKWLEILFKECASRFKDVHIPSHDAMHHKRVWEYAKELVLALNLNGISINECDIELLIIASFFHDQGISETFSAEHGKISRKMCFEYFSHENTEMRPHLDAALEAIELHDQKNYNPHSNRQNTFNLHQVLNIADDLDAFSIIGVYRYLEIYLLRNIPIAEIPAKVMENLDQRYIHFANAFSFDTSLVKNQEKRYLVTRDFFKDMDYQNLKDEYQFSTLKGSIGVANSIIHEIIKGKKDIPQACMNIMEHTNEYLVRYFFSRLLLEYNDSTNIKIEH